MRIALIFIGVIWLGVAGAQSKNERIDENWKALAGRNLSRIEARYDNIQDEVVRLESELVRAGNEMAAVNPDCIELDCRDLEAVYYQVAVAEMQAEAAMQMARMAAREWEALYEAQRGSVKDIEKGKDTIDTTLFLQNTAVKLAELSALMATGGVKAPAKFSYTGSLTQLRTEIAKEQLYGFAGTLSNYVIGKSVDSILKQQTTAGGLVSGLSGNTAMDAAVESLGSHMAGFSLIEHTGRGQYAWSPRLNATSTSKLDGVDAGVQALIQAVTAPWVKETGAQAKQAAADLSLALQQQNAYINIMGYAQVTAVEAIQKRHKILELKNRIETLRAQCNRESAQHACEVEYKKQMAEANGAYETTVAAAGKESEAAAARLAALRTQRDAAFSRASQAHNDLRDARDAAATTTQASGNRALIEELARNAKDPDVRRKYQDQLKALDSVEPDTQARRVSQLEQDREAAWQAVERLQVQIRGEAGKALAIYRENDAIIQNAEVNLIQTLTTIAQNQLDCLESLRPPELERVTISPTYLTAQGEHGPDEIFTDLLPSLDRLASSVDKARIRTHTQRGAQCEIQYQVSDCWQLDHDLFPFDMQWETSGNRVRATLAAKRTNMGFNGGDDALPATFLGTLNGDRLELAHVYNSDERPLLEQIVARDAHDVIGVLLNLPVRATLRGRISRGVSLDVIPGQAIGIGPGPDTVFDVLDADLRYLDHDLVMGFDVGNGLQCPDGTVNRFNDICIRKTDTDRNPVYLNLSAASQEGNHRWIKLDTPWKYVGQVMVYTRPFSQNPAVDTSPKLGERIWLESRADQFECGFQKEAVEVVIEPEKNPDKAFTVVLEETAADSGLFRSDADGIELDFRKRDVLDGFTGNIRFYVKGQETLRGSYDNFIIIYSQ